MTDILLGRLELVARDQVVESLEFKKVEEAIFAGDGFVSPLEYEALFSLFATGDQIRFDDTSDQTRLNTILDGPALTLEHYVQLLAQKNLKPKLSPTQIKTIDQKKLKDKLPKLTQLDVQTDGSFSLTIQDGKTRLTWNHSPSDDPTTTIEEKFAPMQFDWIYLAVVNAYQKAPTQKLKGKLHEVIQAMGQIKKNALKHNAALQKLAFDLGHEGSQNWQELAYHSYLFKQYPDGEKKGWGGGTLKLFQEGKESSRLVKQIKDFTASVPQGLRDVWQTIGTRVYVRPYHQTQRGFLNSLPTDQITSHPSTFGLTTLNNPWHTLIHHDSGMESYSLHALVHELGHNFYLHLDTLTGGQWSEGSSTPGSFHQFILHAFLNQKRQVMNHSYLEKFPTLYSATSPLEYFAEYFAIYFLGKYAPTTNPSGLTDFGQGVDAGFDQLLTDLKTLDPFGFAIMSALDQLLIQGENALDALRNQNALGVLASAVTQENRQILLAQKQKFEDDSAKNQAVTELSGLPATIALMTGFFDMKPDQLDDIKTASLATLDQIESLLAAYPLHETALTVLAELIRVESSDTFWNPIKERCGQIIFNLHMQNPFVPQLFMLFVKSLMQRGKTEQAEELLHDYATDSPDSILVHEVNLLRAKCLIQLNQQEEALALLEKLVGDLLHPASLLRQYPKDYLALRAVLDGAVQELTPLLKQEGREEHVDFLRNNVEILLNHEG